MQKHIVAPEAHLNNFSGTRVRLQRLKDAKLFTGWIVSVADQRVEVRIRSKSTIELGEKFFAQAFGNGFTLSFHSVAIGTGRTATAFEITDEPVVRSSAEEMRVLVDGLKCGVKLGWFEATTDILDVSSHGIGIQTNVAVEKGEHVEISIVAGSGEMLVRGEVRYCRRLEGPVSEFRVGIALFEMDRITTAKWDRLLEQASISATAA